MIFCHYCYKEILDKDFVGNYNNMKYYHIDCFAEMNDIEILPDGDYYKWLK